MHEDQDLARALAGFREQLHVGSHDGAGPVGAGSTASTSMSK
ncbi:hypothetical protein [Streptomyces sp. NPDC021224]